MVAHVRVKLMRRGVLPCVMAAAQMIRLQPPLRACLDRAHYLM